MKDYTEKQLRDAYNPSAPGMTPPLEMVQFCLQQLFDDTTHRFEDAVITGPSNYIEGKEIKKLTFEELIGALLAAERIIKMQEILEEGEEQT